jgi:hypothetical protein
LTTAACPQCGGPAGRQLPWLDIRRCPGAIALLAGGQVIAHMSPAEAARVAGEMGMAVGDAALEALGQAVSAA